jgi:E3 ubiquitin-protein ligase synoviolin
MSGLSDTELSEMEGTERRAVEARIQTLRNIQILLDAAMLQFQQYLAAAVPSGPINGNRQQQQVKRIF